MTKTPKVARNLAALDRLLDPVRRKRQPLALVPTMGALHAGHLELVRQAKRRAKYVVVSIFVNPTQFAPHEDFGTYPRTFKTDLAALTELGVNAIWAPTAAAMYPEGFATRLAPEGAALAGLEDRFRPHFFGGVATVVAKLFAQCRPRYAMFGQKDYQQLRVVTQLAKDLNLGVTVVGIPTIREKDGLALSSRNVYLSPEERRAAPTLQRVLRQSAKRIKAGDALAPVLAAGRGEIMQAGFALDYFEARHAENLAPIASKGEGPIRLLVAAKIGKTRLIDNLGV